MSARAPGLRRGRREWLVVRQVGALFGSVPGRRWLIPLGVLVVSLAGAGVAHLGLRLPLPLVLLWALLPGCGIVTLMVVGVGVPAAIQRLQTSAVPHLVPAHQRTLRRVLAWNWVAAVGLIGLGALVFAALSTSPPGLPAMLAGTSLAALVAALLMIAAARPIALLLATLLLVAPFALDAPLHAGFAALHAGVGAWSALALPALAWGLHRVVQHQHFAGSAAQRAARVRAAMVAMGDISGRGAAPWPTGAGRLETPNLGPAARRWALHRSRSLRPSVRSRLALGPGWSPWALLGPAGWWGLAGGLVLALERYATGTVGSSVPWIAFGATLGLGNGFLASLGSTRTEQALAMLLPGAPAPAARSRWLSDTALRLWAAYSTALLVGWLALALLFRVPGWQLSQLLPLVLCALALDLIATQWAPRRFRHAGTAQINLLAAKLLLLALVTLAAMFAPAFTPLGQRDGPAIAWLICLLWCATAAAIALWLRARRLRDPPALPVGQFG